MSDVSSEVLAERDLRRQRSNKISELMGQCLLKGWRMLESICPVCDTILFMKPDGNTYCVACSEIDKTINSKDQPAASVESCPNNSCGDIPSRSANGDPVDSPKDSFEIIYTETRTKLDEEIEKSLITNRSFDPSVLKGPKALLNRCLHCQTNLILTEEGLPYCVLCGDADKIHLKKSKTMWDDLPIEVKINSIKTQHPLIESIASETTDLPAKRLNQRPDMISGYLFKGWRMGEKCCIVCNAVMFSSPGGDVRCIFCNEVDKKEKQASAKMPKNISAEAFTERERQCQRSDDISQIMGQYLLRGWRMLDKCCSTCDTILMLNREGKQYCIGCSEVDNKDKQELEPKSMQNQPNNGETTKQTQHQPIVDYSKFLRTMKYDASLSETQSTIMNAIHTCSQRVICSSLPMDAERYANAAKFLSEALLNVQKFSST
ncbi:unnamed protein product [Hymenolepis diminuta]|uniref:Sjogrens syndrome scleroderma autoantigen 1 n=1 Tax=Hymenolepis diminuta TaxID=6216 RepID=A0A0R3STD9_HYMDI|nr:unnamed protein product [Hymenolepis diminuta]VUZ42672.1 unnamed protein product [Hymenolepis diminuta]